MDNSKSDLADGVEVINIAPQQATQCKYVRDLTPLIVSIIIIDNATATGARIMTRYVKPGQ